MSKASRKANENNVVLMSGNDPVIEKDKEKEIVKTPAKEITVSETAATLPEIGLDEIKAGLIEMEGNARDHGYKLNTRAGRFSHLSKAANVKAGAWAIAYQILFGQSVLAQDLWEKLTDKDKVDYTVFIKNVNLRFYTVNEDGSRTSIPLVTLKKDKEGNLVIGMYGSGKDAAENPSKAIRRKLRDQYRDMEGLSTFLETIPWTSEREVNAAIKSIVEMEKTFLKALARKHCNDAGIRAILLAHARVDNAMTEGEIDELLIKAREKEVVQA